jgi:hypothetical protein
MLPLNRHCDPAGGLRRSDDQGATWSPRPAQPGVVGGPYGLADGTAAVATRRGPRHRLVVALTRDGNAWQSIVVGGDVSLGGLASSDPVARGAGGLVVVVDTVAGRRILSRAAGRAWRDVTGAIPESTGIAATVRQPGEILDSTLAGSWWRSRDAGASWQAAPTPANNLGSVFAPSVAGLGFGWFDAAGNRIILAVSRDAGRSWHADGSPRMSFEAESFIAVAGSTSDAYLAAGRVLWHWSGRSPRWRIVNRHLPPGLVSTAAGAGPSPLVWLVTAASRRPDALWVSRDGGHRFAIAGGRIAGRGDAVLGIWADAFRPDVVYAQTVVRQVPRLERSVDAGRRWLRAGPSWTTIISPDQTVPGRLWGMDANGNLAVSTDYAAHWQSLIGPPTPGLVLATDVAGGHLVVSTLGDGVWVAPVATALAPLPAFPPQPGWCGPARLFSTPPWAPPAAGGVCIGLSRRARLPLAVWRRLARIARLRGHGPYRLALETAVPTQP